MPKITLGISRWINKEHFPVRMYSHSMRGTKVAMTEGRWLLSELPGCSAPKSQMMALRLMCTLFIYPPMHKHNICDITKWCHNHLLLFSGRKTMHMHRRATPAHRHTCQCPYQMNLTVLIATHKLTHQSHIPNSKPVTLSPRYFGVLSYLRQQFIKIEQHNIIIKCETMYRQYSMGWTCL